MKSTTIKCKKIVTSLISNTYKRVGQTKDQQWKQKGFKEVCKNHNIIKV